MWAKCRCPWVNDWQFTSVVVVAAAVEPCELCDRVQTQGNWGSKWILGGRIALTPPKHRSQLNPPANGHRSVTDPHCDWNTPSIIWVAGACTLEMRAVTLRHGAHIRSTLANCDCSGRCDSSTLQTHLFWDFQHLRKRLDANWFCIAAQCDPETERESRESVWFLSR